MVVLTFTQSEYDLRCERFFSPSKPAREGQAATRREMNSLSRDFYVPTNEQSNPQFTEESVPGRPFSVRIPVPESDSDEKSEIADLEHKGDRSSLNIQIDPADPADTWPSSDELDSEIPGTDTEEKSDIADLEGQDDRRPSSNQSFRVGPEEGWQFPDEEANEVPESDSEESSDITDLEDEADHAPALHHADAPTSSNAPFPRPEASEPSYMISLRHRGLIYPLYFAKSGIDAGLLTIGMVRIAAASELKASDPSHLRLLYKGKLLKNDRMSCKLEGIKHRSELLCVVSEPEGNESSAGDSEHEPESRYTAKTIPSKPRARRRSIRTPRHNSPIRDTPEADTFQFETSPLSPEDVNFKLLPPMEQVNRIAEDFDTYLVPLGNEFVRAPPTEENKRQSEYRAVSERILETVMLRVDGVDARGDPNVRIARKNLILRAQSLLNDLERAARP